MASPSLKVEIAFASTPLNTTPTWVDVSQYVRANSNGGGGVYIHRGHGPEIGPFEAGACTVTLSNRDRRFDPSYAAGPNFGNLIPRKQIRITATWSAVDYPMFTGWVTGWPQGFGPQGKDATVTIEAIDALAWLANNALPNDLVYSYANTTIGSLALFLRGADVSQWSDATGNGYFATPVEGIGKTSSSIAEGSTGTAVVLDISTRWGLTKTYQSTGAWSVSFWFSSNSPGTGANFIYGAPGISLSSGLAMNTTTGVITYGTGSPSGSAQSSPGFAANDGAPHHVAVTSDGATTAAYKIYIDGVDRTASTSGSYQVFVLEQVGMTSGQSASDAFAGSIEDVAVWNKQLSALEVQGLYQRSFGFLQEAAAVRVTRLLDDVGWPAAWRAITSNSRASVGELVYNGSSALPKLQEVERSEQGMLFADKSGNVAFRERYYTSEVTVGAVAQQIFSDDGGATAAPYSTFQFQFNDIDVTNSVSVTTPTTRAASSDATSITANGLQSKQVDTILSTFTQANDMAAGLVAKGKNATYRVAPITVYPSKNTTRWDEILTLELGYRASMEITPMAVGTQNVQDVTLEQIEWSIVDTLWTLTVAGSPVPSTSAGTGNGWFIIGTSLIGSTTDLIGY